jgi:hypothetical protein
MTYSMFELLPFVCGFLYGLLQFRQKYTLRWEHFACTSVGIGIVCAFSAGELFGTLTTALECIAFDSAAVAGGCACLFSVLKTLLSPGRTYATREK